MTLAAAAAATGFVPYSGDADGPRAAAAEDLESTGGDVFFESGPTLSAADPDDPRAAGQRAEAPRRFAHGDPNHVPPKSGQGRRVVYDISDQRVWLVGANGQVRRSYIVSGSVLDNLKPGSYEVYSRSRHAVAFDQRSTMDYMVRFTEGDNAAIGFHDIPEDLKGRPMQTVDQLGTPRSHGCIRQRPADARAMWRFAVVDTPVRVLA